MAFCLTKQAADRFKKALASGEINPIEMSRMTTEVRREFLSKYVGVDNAKEVNALFESKLLLKRQKQGYITWAKKVAGISTPARRDLMSRIERLDKVLNPAEEQVFLNDLADLKLGTTITREEAQVVSDLATRVKTLRENYDPKTEKWSSETKRIEYGSTRRALENYVEELKQGEFTLSSITKKRLEQAKIDIKENPVRGASLLVMDSAKTIADNSVSLVASFDNSLFGRQGITMLLTGHPVIWLRNFAKSFNDIAGALKGKNTTDALLADLYTDPLFISGEYKEAGIYDIKEEQYPTSLPERVPGLGRIFKASEQAFVNGSLRMRTELYKIMREAKVARGIELTKEEIQGMGKVVNSLGAKGHLGRHGQNAIARLLMWAPKMLKADIDILTAHSFSDIPKSDRVTARWNLAKIILISTMITAIAKYNNKDVELDPRSTDFLKVDNKYNYLRGMPAVITLMSRMITGEYKTRAGETKKYESGFGKQSRLDAIYSFMRGKAPPATGAVYDILSGQDYNGNEPTFSSILLQRGVPISIQNIIELAKQPSLDRTFGVIADFFGLSVNLEPSPNVKSNIIPKGEVLKNEDFLTAVGVYAEAIGTDPETAFNRIFTGQKIMQVSDGGIIVVDRQDVKDSEAFKRDWVKEHGGSKEDIKQVRLDHTIPNKLGGSETPDNWKIVPVAVWQSYTATENLLISAVKKDKISLKDAQKEIVKFKQIENTEKRKTYGDSLKEKYK